jgi:hypothetical protein
MRPSALIGTLLSAALVVALLWALGPETVAALAHGMFSWVIDFINAL